MRLIDADALVPDTEYDDYYDAFLSFSYVQIDDAPTIEAEPVRHCRCIPKYQPPDPKASWSTEYYCSGCGHETHMTVMPDQRDNYIDDYFGGCGARMDGGSAAKLMNG